MIADNGIHAALRSIIFSVRVLFSTLFVSVSIAETNSLSVRLEEPDLNSLVLHIALIEEDCARDQKISIATISAIYKEGACFDLLNHFEDEKDVYEQLLSGFWGLTELESLQLNDEILKYRLFDYKTVKLAILISKFESSKLPARKFLSDFVDEFKGRSSADVCKQYPMFCFGEYNTFDSLFNDASAIVQGTRKPEGVKVSR